MCTRLFVAQASNCYGVWSIAIVELTWLDDLVSLLVELSFFLIPSGFTGQYKMLVISHTGSYLTIFFPILDFFVNFTLVLVSVDGTASYKDTE